MTIALDPHLMDWLSLGLRWLHVVAGIAWVGTSFYFAWLANHLHPPGDTGDRVAGGLWAIHGGAFHRIEKYQTAPDRLPEPLHWFKWEAYTTWLSGAGLLVVVYYLGSGALLVDPTGAPFGRGSAILLGVAVIAGGWLLYDLSCRTPLLHSPGRLAVLGVTALTLISWVLNQFLSSRAAWIHVGALIGTIMVGNVFRVIIPNQKRMVAAMAAGHAPDHRLGRAAAARSLHNNYLTLPVVLIMLSPHYSMTHGHRWGWAILPLLVVIGAGIRHHLNLKARSLREPWLLPSVTLAVVAVIWLSRPGPLQTGAEGAAQVSFEEVSGIIERRCVSCHAARPTHQAFVAAPLGVLLERPEQIQALASRIRSVAVSTHTMPFGNLTAMADEERAALGRWIDEGARIDR